jgi:hypothetical protein
MLQRIEGEPTHALRGIVSQLKSSPGMGKFMNRQRNYKRDGKVDKTYGIAT